MTRNIFEGSEFLLYDINNNPIALSKNCALKIKQNVIDVTTKDSDNWQENIVGIKDWSIDFEGLVSYDVDKFNTSYFLAKFQASEPFFIQFGVIQNNFNHTFWGEVAIENINIDSNNGEVVSYSGSLKGIGSIQFTNEGTPEQSGYLKTETDPVFRGSAAFNITETNKNDWFDAYNKTLTEVGFSTVGNKTTLNVKLRDGSIYSTFFNQTGSGSGNVDLSAYYTSIQSDARFQPLGNYVGQQYLSDYHFTKTESNTLYKNINWLPNWSEVQDKPNLFDGNYNSLINKPFIPTLTSQLINDAGYVTSSIVNGYATEQWVLNKNYLTVESDTLDSVLGKGNSSGKNINVSGIATFNGQLIIPAASSNQNQSIWIGSANSTGNNAPLISFLNDLGDVTLANAANGQALVFNGYQWVNQTIVTDLTNYFTKGESNSLFKNINWLPAWNEVSGKPTSLSQFSNDLGNYGGWAKTDGSNATGNWNINISGTSDRTQKISNQSAYMTFHWSGQGGQPTWVWGGNAADDMYVYNPSNFSVANAVTWNGQHYNGAEASVNTYIMAYGADGHWHPSSANSVGNWLGNYGNWITAAQGSALFQEKENQRLSTGNNVQFNAVKAANELVIPSSASSTNQSIWIGSANSNGSNNPTVSTLASLQDVSFSNLTNGQSIQYDSSTGRWKNVNFQLAGNYANVDGSNASGNWGINITGTARFLSSPDGTRNPNDIHPSANPNRVRFDFSNAGGHTTTGGNYAGVMTFSPWTGTVASTGDASYQMAFGSVSANATGVPQLRIRNGIEEGWNSWYKIYTSANIGEIQSDLGLGSLAYRSEVPSTNNVAWSLAQRDESGYLTAGFINTPLSASSVKDDVPVSLYGNMNTQGYHYSFSQAAVRNFLGLGSFAYRQNIYGSEVITSINDSTVDIDVAKKLRWTAYGNGHVIFDASAALAPNGATISSTDSQQPWSNTYPTLMGWNGSASYGVRVDSARVADFATISERLKSYNGANTVQWGWDGNRITFKVDASDFGNNVPLNISGTAATATRWGGAVYTGSEVSSIQHYMIGYSETDGTFHPANVTAVRSWLGLGSAAYNSQDEASTPYTIAQRSAGGDINVRLIRSEYPADTGVVGGGYFLYQNQTGAGTDNYARPTSVSLVKSILGLGASAFVAETLESVATRNNNVYRDINIRGGSSLFYYNANNSVAGRADMRDDVLHQYSYRASDGVALPWKENWYDGTKYHSWTTDNSGFVANSKITAITDGSGSNTYGGALETRGTNAGITFHYPGSYAAPLWMNAAGILNWSGLGISTNGYLYASTTVDAGGFVRGQRIIAGYDSGVAGSVNASGWFRSEGQTGWYSSSYQGGIYMSDSTWVRVYGDKGFLVNNQVRAVEYQTMGGSYYVDNYGLGLVGLYDATRYQGVFSMGNTYKPSVDGTSLGNSYGIVWTHEYVGGQSKSGLGHQMLITAAGETQTAIGNGIWTRANIYAAGKIEAPTMKATSKMVIPTSAPSAPENGCLWIS